MPDSCPDCGHSVVVHFLDDEGVFRCGVPSCDCSDEEDED